MAGPEFEQFGITKGQFDSINANKSKLRNYTFGIASAIGILTGCVVGLKLSSGLYETVLFILFFGCFLGSLFGAAVTITVVRLYSVYLYFASSTYRKSRQYLAARSKADLDTEKRIY